MQILVNAYGRVEAICGFTTAAHGVGADLRMPWSQTSKLRPGVGGVPD